MIISLSYFLASTAKKHPLTLHQASGLCRRVSILSPDSKQEEPSLLKHPSAGYHPPRSPTLQSSSSRQRRTSPHNTLQKATAPCHRFQGHLGTMPQLEFGKLPPYIPSLMCLLQSCLFAIILPLITG